MTNRTESGDARELRVLLAAVFEALDIPHPATVGDAEAHDRILKDRVIDARVALEGVLRRGDEPGWSAEYLQGRLAEKPATGYRTAGSAVQPRDEAAEERVRRSVDAQFPAVAAFLADERPGDKQLHDQDAEGQAAGEVARWNAAHSVGTPVTAYPITRDDEALTTRTRSVAWLLGGHTAVVLVDDYSGGIALTHVDAATGAEGSEGR